MTSEDFAPIASQLLACHRKILRMPDGDEILQQVTLRCLTKAADRDWDVDQHGYIMTIAKRIAIDLSRRRKTRASVEEKIAAMPRRAPLAPAEAASRREGFARMQTAIASLPHEQQQVIAGTYFQGMTSSELAKQLGIPEGTIKKRKTLAMNRLKNVADLHPYSSGSFISDKIDQS